LRQKHAIELLGLLELGAHLYVRGRLRYLGAEAEVVDIQLCVHSLRSRVVCLGAIVASSIWGTLLFVASDEAAEKRDLPGNVVSLIWANAPLILRLRLTQ
jgi:hypothetical protein